MGYLGTDYTEEEWNKMMRGIRKSQGINISRDELKYMLEDIFPKAKITTLGEKSYRVFILTLKDLIEYNPDYAYKLLDNFETTIREIKLALFASSEECIEYDVRIVPYSCFEYSNHTNIKQYNVGKMLRFKGQVNKITKIYTKNSHSKFSCPRCNVLLTLPYLDNNDKSRRVMCVPCTDKYNSGKKDKDPYKEYFMQFVGFEKEDYQQISFQESNDTMKDGEHPQTLSGEIRLCKHQDDYWQNTLVGKYVDVVATIADKSEFDLKINNIIPLDKETLTEKDREEVKQILNDKEFHTKICQDIAGDIIGLDKLKELILMIFIGLKQEIQHITPINILIVGDYGTGKTELVTLFVNNLRRGELISGSGVTEAGLLGFLEKNLVTERWEYSAGAFLLNNGGVLALDEKDKMPEEIEKAMHTVSSNGTYSIVKSGYPNCKFFTDICLITCANPKDKVFKIGSDDPVRNQIEESASMLDRYAMIVYIPFTLWTDEQRTNEIWLNIMKKNSGQAKTKVYNYGIEKINKIIDYLREQPNPIFPEILCSFLRNNLLEIEKKFSTTTTYRYDEPKNLIFSNRNVKYITLLSRIRARLFNRTEVIEEDVSWVLQTFIDLQWNFEYKNFGALNRFDTIVIQSQNLPKSDSQRMDKIMEFFTERKNEQIEYSTIHKYCEGIGITEWQLEKILETMCRNGIIFQVKPSIYRIL